MSFFVYFQAAMVKVKAKVGGEVAGQKVSGKYCDVLVYYGEE